MLKFLVCAAAFAVILLRSSHAAAWCLLDKALEYPTFWALGFPDLRIDVYVSLGERSSFLQTGLTLPQAEAIVRRMVAIHNETVGPPYLVYGGTTTAELELDPKKSPLYKNRPFGIVLESFTCEDWPCEATDHACARISGKLSDNEAAKGRVSFRPAESDCPGVKSHPWGLDQTSGSDAASVLLHELGHVLGLGHTGLDEAECGGPTDGAGGSGVMRTPPGASFPAARDWRRDDIEGLRAIYGDAIEHAVYAWTDSAFPASPPELSREALCAEIRTPPALTDAVGDGAGGPAQYLAFTGAHDRVAYLEWNGEAFAPPAFGAVIDPGDLGVSFAPPAIAHGDTGGGRGRLFAVWSAGESKTSAEVRLRWALRSAGSGAWTYGFLTTPDGATQRSNDVAVGFDRGTSMFVVASVTNDAHPYFVALDLAGHQAEPLVLGAEAVTPPFVFDVGTPACFTDGGASRCVVPYISSNFEHSNPGFEVLRAGWYDLELKAGGEFALVDDTLAPELEPRGMVDLAPGPDGFRGVVGDRRYALERLPGVGATDTPVLDAEAFPAGDWPLRVGSQDLGGDAASYRIVARRLGNLCGNGAVDCDEACDDGNTADDDGCSALCHLEPSSTTGDPTTGAVTEGAPEAVTEGVTPGNVDTEGMTTAGPATASGAGPTADDGGCACTSRGGGSSPQWLLGIVALLGTRKPRRGRVARSSMARNRAARARSRPGEGPDGLVACAAHHDGLDDPRP